MLLRICGLVCVLIAHGVFALIIGQQPYLGKLSMFSANEKTKQQVSAASVANLKLISRKPAYRYGETIDLSLGLLNTSSQMLFFVKPDIIPLATITAKDEQGKEQQIRENEVFAVNVAPESYSLIFPQYLLVARFYILAGCDTPEIQMWRKNKMTFYEDAKKQNGFEYQRELFERELFGDFEYGCLNYVKEGNYTFSVSVNNEHILTSSARPDIKTAVGNIASNPLQLKIYK
jgi:hypothetical protein